MIYCSCRTNTNKTDLKQCREKEKMQIEREMKEKNGEDNDETLKEKRASMVTCHLLCSGTSTKCSIL